MNYTVHAHGHLNMQTGEALTFLAVDDPLLLRQMIKYFIITNCSSEKH